MSADAELRRALDAWEQNGAPNRRSLAAFGIRAALAARSEPRAELVHMDDVIAEIDQRLARSEPRAEGLREALRVEVIKAVAGLDGYENPNTARGDYWDKRCIPVMAAIDAYRALAARSELRAEGLRLAHQCGDCGATWAEGQRPPCHAAGRRAEGLRAVEQAVSDGRIEVIDAYGERDDSRDTNHRWARLDSVYSVLAATPPAEGPTHYPHCNDRCVHYMEGSVSSRFSLDVAQREPGGAEPRQGAVTEPSTPPAEGLVPRDIAEAALTDFIHAHGSDFDWFEYPGMAALRAALAPEQPE